MIDCYDAIGQGRLFQNQRLPDEILASIFSKLKSDRDLIVCSLVCKFWNTQVNIPLYENNIFDESKWKKIFGEIGNADGSSLPLLPKKIQYEILNKACPFWPEKTIGKTHILMLLPETVNGKLLTLKTFGKLLKNKYSPKNIHGFKAISSRLIEEQSEECIGPSRWVLMTKNLLPHSQNIDYLEQKVIIERMEAKVSGSYRIPKVLEAIVCIYAKQLNSETSFFCREFTRCQEQINESNIIVGQYDSDGLRIYNNSRSLPVIGVAALREI